ncbi:MAG: phage tail spike protein [Culicoidibacterales bacterium]
MLQLYDQFETEFKVNGDMLSGAYNAEIIHYLNSEYTLKFSIKQSDEKAHLIKSDAIVLADNQPFRILTPKILGDSIEVYAVHVFYDLKDYQIEAVNVEAVSGQTAMNAIFNNANTNFTWKSDITKLSTMNEEKKNIIEMLNIAIERFGGELIRNKFDVRLNNKAGVDTEVLIYPEKNISQSIKEIDTTDVCTRVIVEYGDYEEKKQVIVTSTNIGLYSHPKTKRYQNFTDGVQTEADAIEWGLGKFKGINRIDTPKVSVEIDVLLDNSLKNLKIGDTVICKIPNLNLDERIQIIGYAYDPLLERKTKIFCGYKAKGLGGTIIGGAVEAIRPEIEDVDDKLQAEIDNANNAIQKEYEERVESVNDAIVKAEADVARAKEELNKNLSNEFLALANSQNTTKIHGNLLVERTIGANRIIGNSIGANEIVAGTADLAEITSILFKTQVLEAAWANIGNAIINKLTVDDALLLKLTAKHAFITTVQSIDFQAERIVGGRLKSTNGSYEQNLNSGETLYKTGSDVSRIKMGDFYDVRGLYMQAGTSNVGTELMLSKTGMAYFNADHISLGRSSQNAGFKFVANAYTGTSNPAANRIIPWTAGTGSFGQGSYPCYEVRVYNVTDLYSVNRVSTTLSMYEAFTELNALEIVGSTQVNSYITPDATTQKFNLEDDQPKKVRIGIDFTNLRRSRSIDSTLLFNEQNEMTLNTEIAILWKAVQELTTQLHEIKGA